MSKVASHSLKLLMFSVLVIPLTSWATITETTYTYDTNSNRATEFKIVDGNLETNRNYNYNDHNQLTSITDNLDNTQSITYTYDGNGNRSSKTQGSNVSVFTYNAANQLVEVEENATSLGQFSYDYQGMRLQKIGERGTENYVYDDQSVLYQTDENDNLTAKYNYGPYQLLSLTEAGGEQQYYLFDALGSPITLAKIDGSVSARYSYDSFGNKILETGNSFNRFAFTGHEEDRETNLVYMKARYMDPDTGQFLTQDNFGGFPDNPPSLNKYLYAYGNPTTYVDPDGNIVFLPIVAYIAVTAVNSAVDTAGDVAINEVVSRATGESNDTSLAGVAKNFGENFGVNLLTGNLGGKLKKAKTISNAAEKINKANKRSKSAQNAKKADAPVQPSAKADRPSQGKVVKEKDSSADVDVKKENGGKQLTKHPFNDGASHLTTTKRERRHRNSKAHGGPDGLFVVPKKEMRELLGRAKSRGDLEVSLGLDKDSLKGGKLVVKDIDKPLERNLRLPDAKHQDVNIHHRPGTGKTTGDLNEAVIDSPLKSDKSVNVEVIEKLRD